MEQLQIINILKDIGFKPSLIGFKYLVRAIQEYNSCDGKLKQIYYNIARQYSVTSSSVEGSIRRCIEACFNRSTPNDTWYTIFSNVFGDDKPNNKLVIICIAQYINNKEVI